MKRTVWHHWKECSFTLASSVPCGRLVVSASNTVNRDVASLNHILPHACLPVGLYEGHEEGI